jgi:hypothetical protein
VPPEVAARILAAQDNGPAELWPRDKAEFARFFQGLELIEPGITAVCDWRPDREDRPKPVEVSAYGAVGEKRK